MLFQQFLSDDLGCASYLVADEQAGVAVVVDPPYAIEPVLEEAERREVRLVGVLETHTHADHVSGHGRLALEHGIPVRLHGAAEATFPHEPLSDGTEIELGDVVLRTIHTPGHRPEHCCFLADGHLLTGDSLLIGDAARPDLAVEATEGAAALYDSLERLAGLPEGTEVDPGHVAGSLCATGISSARSSTIAMERLSNRALAYGDADEFVAAHATISAPRPPTTETVVALNRGPFVGAPAELGRPEQFDGQVLDEVARLQEHPDVACPERGPVGLGAPGEPGSGDGHVAPVGLVEAGKARHQRRLPAPGRADDRDHLAAVHRE